MSHQASCEFVVQIESLEKKSKSLLVTAKIEKLAESGEAMDPVYCSSRIGDEIKIEFSEPMPKIESDKKYDFVLRVSGGKTAAGVQEVFEWSYKDFMAKPIQRLTPREG